jgi:hypothetical protein
VKVESIDPLRPSKLDVAIVLDTAAEAPEAVYRRARSLVTALVDNLPARVRVTVISAGGTADVLSPLGTDRAESQDGITDAPRGRGHAWLDGIVHAADTLPDNPDRVAQVVVVTTGPDDASARNTQHVRSVLADRGVALSVTAAGEPGDQVLGGEQCPARVTGQTEAAAAVLAQRLAGRYLAVAPAADLAQPLTVRVRSGQVDVSATTVPALTTGAAETAVLGTKLGTRVPDSASTTWAPLGLGLLAMLILAALVVPVLTTADIGARLTSRPSAHRARRSTDYRRSDPEHEELRVDAWMARLCLLFLLPAGLAARLQLGDFGLQGAAEWAAIGLAAVLGGLGSWWLWRSTTPPYPLWAGRTDPRGPRVTAVAPFCLCLLPAVLLVALG